MTKSEMTPINLGQQMELTLSKTSNIMFEWIKSDEEKIKWEC